MLTLQLPASINLLDRRRHIAKRKVITLRTRSSASQSNPDFYGEESGQEELQRLRTAAALAGLSAWLYAAKVRQVEAEAQQVVQRVKAEAEAAIKAEAKILRARALDSFLLWTTLLELVCWTAFYWMLMLAFKQDVANVLGVVFGFRVVDLASKIFKMAVEKWRPPTP